MSQENIMTQQPAIINFQSNQGTQQAFGHVENVNYRAKVIV